MDINIEWVGLKEWQKTERDWQDRVNRLTHEEVKQIAFQIERDAKMLSPVDTGELRASIEAIIQSTSQKAEAEVGTDVGHAKPVEFGTSRQRAQPYLIPAFNKNTNDLVKRLSNVMEG